VNVVSSNSWSSKTLFVTIQSRDTEVEHDLSTPYALVGSRNDCDVVIHDKATAGRALLLMCIEDRIQALVLTPSSRKSGRLLTMSPDKPLTFGSTRLTARFGNANQDGTDSSLASLKNNDTSVVTLTWKKNSIRQYTQLPHAVPILLGRKSPSRILVDDPNLSGTHCCILRMHDRAWAIDLASTNGTRVGRHKARCMEIPLDKSMVAGKRRFHFLRLHTDQALSPSSIPLPRADLPAETEPIADAVAQAAVDEQQQPLADRQLRSSLAAAMDEVTEGQEIIAQLSQRLAQSEQDASDAQAHADRLQTQSDQQTAELEQLAFHLQETNAARNSVSNHFQLQADEATEQLRQAIEDRDRLADELRQARVTSDTTAAERDAALDQHAEVTDKLQQAISENESLKQQLAQRTADLDQQQSKYEQVTAELQDRLEQQIDGNEDQQQRYESEIAELWEQLAEHETMLQQQQMDREAEIAKHAQRVTDLLRERDALEQQLATDQPERLQQMEHSLRQRELELQRIQHELDAERSILASLDEGLREATGLHDSESMDNAELTDDTESCIASFDFQSILTQALDALPPIDDGRDEPPVH